MNFISHLHHLFLPHESNNQRAKILHPSSFVVIISFFVLFQIFLHQAASALPSILGYASQISPSEVIRLTNLERESRGLNTVQLDQSLSLAASWKANDMFSKNYWAHVSPTGTQPWYFITDSGYSYRFAGENLARDFSDPQSVVNAWMESPTHRENLLNPRYADIGVAVLDGKLDGRETTLVVQMFGTKISSTTPPNISKTSSFTVKAAETGDLKLQQTNLQKNIIVNTPKPSNPIFSPFDITKYFSLILLGLFVLVLLADIFVVHRASVVRWTSKSFAHLIFFIVLIIAIASVLSGRIA